MSNNFYNHSGYPNPNAAGSSAALRAELDAIGAGFEKLPTLTGNGYKVAMIASDGLSLIASAALQALAITASTIDSTVIGATTKAAGSFTNLTVTGTASLGSTIVMSGGTIDNTIIGGTTRAAGYFTTLAANAGITGNLTGNVTGNLTGNVTGNVTGDLSGNVSTTSGTSSFNNVTIIGTLDMSSGTAGTITGLSTPTNASDAATKSYVDTADALKLNLAGGTMSGAIAMGTSKITGLGDPTANQDAATKAYVDSVAQGLDAKASVRVATTANITLSNTQTIDGIALSIGDRVLVKDQSTASQNGIYVVASGSWTRATDADTWVELTSAFTFVEQGTANANNGYTCTIAQGGTIGTTAVTWVQFSGAGQITAGAGLTKTGNTLDVGTASSSRIVVNANDIDLATTGVTIGTYAGLTVDAYGRVTSASTLTTLAGYGITNAYTKTEVDAADALKLNLSGGTMSGNIAMGSNKVTGLAAPSAGGDATNKTYVDAILGSATAAATSAAAAAVSESNAANSATAAAGSATAAAGSATAAAGSATSAAASYTTFHDIYQGAYASAPATRPSGGAIQIGDLYFNTVLNSMQVYSSTGWVNAGSSVNGTSRRYEFVATAGQTTFSGVDANGATLGYDSGYIDVYLNGSRLKSNDFTATSGTSVVLAVAASLNDELNIVAYGTFSIATHVLKSGDTMTGQLTVPTLQVNGNAAYTGTLTGGTGIVNLGSGQFYKDASGNVGIGTASPTALGAGRTSVNINGSTDAILWLGSNGTYTGYVQGAVAACNLVGNGVDLQLSATGAKTISFITNGSERARIDSSGRLLVGTTSSFASTAFLQVNTYQNGAAAVGFATKPSTNANYDAADFYNSSGTKGGYISCTSSATTYSTTSDYRLKDNITPMTGALDKVAQLNPVTYTWKIDGSACQGFIAHELQEIVPECVHGEKDAVNEDGSIKPQGIDTSFLVATLTAAIQELKAELDAAKERITALEGAQ